jgi:hypothetical protein
MKAPAKATAKKVYAVVDSEGEYLGVDGKRTPLPDKAKEFKSRKVAQKSCERATDLVLEWDVE